MPGNRTRTEERILLAVLPVADRVDLLGDAEAVFAGLATWLAVRRLAAPQPRSPMDFQRIAAGSGVRYVLHGWTESERDQIRLTVELNEAASGRVLWSGRVDRRLTERHGLRSDIAGRIGQEVPEALLRRELDRTALEPADALTAQDLALQAFSAIMQPRLDTFAAAATRLAEAQTRDGTLTGMQFASVWWHLMAISQGWGSDPQAVMTAVKALDRDDPASVALAAYTTGAFCSDHVAASARLDLVLDNAPLCGVAASFKALVLCALNEANAAVALAEQASRMPTLGPERAWRHHVTALACYCAGRYEEAVHWARLSASRHAGLAENIRILASSLAVLGHLDEAQRAASQVLTVNPDFRVGRWRQYSLLPENCLEPTALRLRLAGLPL